MIFIDYLYVAVFISRLGLNQAQDAAKDLQRDLFKIYDSQSMPIKNSTKIEVCVGLYLVQIVGLSEKSQVMHMF